MPEAAFPVAPRPIFEIQGEFGRRAQAGSAVSTQGLVTGVRPTGKDAGFFLQDQHGDGNDATPDGIFVRTSAVRDAEFGAQLQPGTPVRVTGKLTDAMPINAIQAARKGVELLGEPVPAEQRPQPQLLQLPDRPAEAQGYMAARQSTLVQLDQPLVVGPSTAWGTYWAVDEGRNGPGKPFFETRAGQVIGVSDKLGVKAQLGTGDRPGRVVGPVSADWSGYTIMQADRYPTVVRGPVPAKQRGDITGDGKVTQRDVDLIRARVGEQARGPLDAADLTGTGKITDADVRHARRRMQAQARLDEGGPTFQVASYNMWNLFDTVNSPDTDDKVLSARQYEHKLHKLATSIRDELHSPDVIALQEIENERVLKDLVQREQLRDLDYRYAIVPGPDPRGINIAMLYRGDSVKVNELRQAHTDVADAPLVADDARDEGGRLFARPPLLADVTITRDGHEADLTVIANHFKSKFSPDGAPTQPARTAQAQYIGRLVEQLREQDPDRNVVVLGDLNDHDRSRTVRELTGPADDPRLVNVVQKHVPRGERYSFVHRGKSQQIDHILVNPELESNLAYAGVRHFNLDYPGSHEWGKGPKKSSDHAQPYAIFSFPTSAAQASAGAAAVMPPAHADAPAT